MLTENHERRLSKLRKLARTFDRELKQRFGAENFSAGYCLLLGRYYAQSRCVYFSLNPGFPRNGFLVDPSSPEGYNVPFKNPEALRKQYVYLHNCQRFFSAYPHLDEWINNRVTSAFLVPWRTSNMSDLRRLNQMTEGQVFSCAGRLVKQMIRDHEAKLLITAGRSALDLLGDLHVTEKVLERSEPLGPGKSYQWSKWRLSVEGAEMDLLQIPHFSRANSPVKMRGLALWLTEQLKPFGCGEGKVVYSRVMDNTEQIRGRLLARQAELEQGTSRFGQDALQSSSAEVQDEIDQVISSEAKTASMELSSRQFLALQDVQAALGRLEDGTYGQCVVCGRPIEPARLRAIPETPYCIEHAKQAEDRDAGT